METRHFHPFPRIDTFVFVLGIFFLFIAIWQTQDLPFNKTQAPFS